MTNHELCFDRLTDDEAMALSRAVLGWADRVFAGYPPMRKGQILDWAQDLIDLRDEIDRVILWRAVVRSLIVHLLAKNPRQLSAATRRPYPNGAILPARSLLKPTKITVEAVCDRRTIGHCQGRQVHVYPKTASTGDLASVRSRASRKDGQARRLPGAACPLYVDGVEKLRVAFSTWNDFGAQPLGARSC